jgi:hypothetical protein
MKKIAVFTCIAMLSACQMVNAPRGIKSVSAQGVLDTSKSVYVSVGPDGKYFSFPMQDKKEAIGSGQSVADIVFTQTSNYQPRVVKGVQMETEEQALSSARNKGLDYVLYSRANVWSEANYLTCSPSYLNTVDVDLSAYEVATGKAVRVDKLYNAGCPTKVFSIPLGLNSADRYFRDVLTIWLSENFRERR